MTIPGSSNPLLAYKAAGASAYQVSRSLRFNSSDSAYLSRTPSVAGNRKTWTWSGWVKRSSLTAVEEHLWIGGVGQTTDATYQRIYFDSSNKLRVSAYSISWRTTTQVFRDFSAWFHLVVAVDTTQSTPNNRVRIYVNGSEVTAFDTVANPNQNDDTGTNNNTLHYIGAESGPIRLFNGYLAECYLIDGQALTPSSFGQTDANGEWQPIAYTGTYGTNGFKLNFADNSAATAAALGKDTSPNGNNWTPTNLSVTAGAGNDSLVDTPTSYGTDTGVGGEVRGNYATFNPVNLTSSGSHALTNGNLEVIGGTGWTSDVSTFPTGATGKWYAEITLAGTFATTPFVGIAKSTSITSNYIGSSSDSYGYRADATKYNNGGSAAYGATFAAGDIIGIAYDADAGTLVFYKNGVSQGTAYTGLSGPFFIGGSFWTSSTTVNAIANFGQRPFAYTAPSGFKALCDTNLPTPVISKSSTQMDVVTYTGTGAARSITSLGFSPDFVWIKQRSGTTSNHGWFDTVRGTNKMLISNPVGGSITDGEYTKTQSLMSFDSNGFSLGTSSDSDVNTNANTFAAWCWKGGTSNATNTSGSITSTVRANTTAGFSIITYTGNGTVGATIGHGLGVVPTLIIIKSRNATNAWNIYTTVIDGSLDYFDFSTAAKLDSAQSVPTSSVFSVSAGANVNANGTTYAAWCWAPVAAYSATGIYIGNGSADGPFVYTGFRPRWIMLKRATGTTGGSDWLVYDSLRPGYNLSDLFLKPHTSEAEQSGSTNNPVDILSNGFKIRWSTANSNPSGDTMVYLAFAESPFAYSRAR